MKEENMSEVMRVLKEWSNSVSPKSPIEKTYVIVDNEVTLTLLVSFGDDPTKDKSFIRTCKADVSSVIKTIKELEENKASFFNLKKHGHVQLC